MTFHHILYVVLLVIVWNLGRAQLRAELYDKQLSREKALRERDVTSWNRRGYDR